MLRIYFFGFIVCIFSICLVVHAEEATSETTTQSPPSTSTTTSTTTTATPPTPTTTTPGTVTSTTTSSTTTTLGEAAAPPLTPCELYNKIKMGSSLDQVKDAVGKDNAAMIKRVGSNYQWSSHFGILDITLEFLDNGTYLDGSYPTQNLNQNEQFLEDLAKNKTITLSKAEEFMGQPGIPAGGIYYFTLPDKSVITITTDKDNNVSGVVSNLNCPAPTEE